MSKVAKRFWNHKRIAQSEAREHLKKLGILVGVEAEQDLLKEYSDALRAKVVPQLTKQLFRPSPLFERLTRGR